MYTFSVTADYTFRIADQRLGFVDRDCAGYGRMWSDTHLELGSLGTYEMPAAAATCWAVVVLAVLVALTLAGWLAGRRARVVRIHSLESTLKEDRKFAAGERGR
jgi:hypothetical protein